MKQVFRKTAAIFLPCITVLAIITVYTGFYPYKARVIFFPLYREAARRYFAMNTGDFHSIESKNFNIFYKETDKDCLNMIKHNAEKGLNDVAACFSYVHDGKINLMIYSEPEEMANKIGLSAGAPAMGVYYGGTISILEPSKWIKDKSSIARIFSREGPMVHELIHYVFDHITCGNIPVWFAEGIALYGEYEINGVEWASNKVYEDYYSVKELDEEFYRLDETKGYKQSFLIVKYIGDNMGIEKIIGIAKKLGSGKSMDQAVYEVLDMSVEQLFTRSLGNYLTTRDGF